MEKIADYLASLPVNDKDHPYTIPSIAELVDIDKSSGAMSSSEYDSLCSRIRNALKNTDRYLDLSGISIANKVYSVSYGSQSLGDLFDGCDSIVVPPMLPNPYYSDTLVLTRLYKGCDNLTTIPAGSLPTGFAYHWSEAFAGCTGLTDASGMFGSSGRVNRRSRAVRA